MRVLAYIAVLGLSAAPVMADWDHPVKWDQKYPLDTFGAASWIDNDTPSDALSADDWLCTIPMPVTDIEFSGWSSYGDQYLNQFRITFWNDVPRTPDDESHPGDLLYEYYADPADEFGIGWQVVYDPEHDHDNYKINLPEEYWFYQEGTPENPVVYWIGIQGVMVDDGAFDAFYWQFRERGNPAPWPVGYEDWNDDAAFASEYFGYQPWANWGWPTGSLADPDMGPDLYEGPFPFEWDASADLSFRLTYFPEPTSLLLLGLGGLALIRRR